MGHVHRNTPQFLQAKGPAKVWFYRDPGSVNFYVKLLGKDGAPLLQAPISFRLILAALK